MRRHELEERLLPWVPGGARSHASTLRRCASAFHAEQPPSASAREGRSAATATGRLRPMKVMPRRVSWWWPVAVLAPCEQSVGGISSSHPIRPSGTGVAVGQRLASVCSCSGSGPRLVRGKEQRMPYVDFTAPADGGASRSIDRRTLLVGVAGALTAAGLSGPAHAAGSAATVAVGSGRRFDPDLARELQRVLRDALRDPSSSAPGAILHVRSPRLGAWTGVVGRGRVAPDVPMRPGDRFRAGSIAKPFVAVVVLQLAERGRLSLDARLPDVLPASVVGRFPTAGDITVRMLLSNRSGDPGVERPRRRGAGRAPSREGVEGLRVPRSGGRSASGVRSRDRLLLLQHQLQPAGAGHRAGHRPLLAPRSDATRHPPTAPDAHAGSPGPGHRSIRGAHAHGYAAARRQDDSI